MHLRRQNSRRRTHSSSVLTVSHSSFSQISLACSITHVSYYMTRDKTIIVQELLIWNDENTVSVKVRKESLEKLDGTMRIIDSAQS